MPPLNWLSIKNVAMHKQSSRKEISQICYGIEIVDAKFISMFMWLYGDATKLFSRPKCAATHCRFFSPRCGKTKLIKNIASVLAVLGSAPRTRISRV
jgi:hypothetical protein